MANSLTKIQDIDFKQTILQPLEACIDAQAQATRIAHKHMMTYMFQRRPNGDFAPVEMTFEFSNSEGSHVLHVPLLCLMPIPSIQIDDITFSYIATVNRYEKNKMTVNYSRLNLDESIESERSMKGELQVRLTAGVSDMPMGITQLLELFGNHYPTFNTQENVTYIPELTTNTPKPSTEDDSSGNLNDTTATDVVLKNAGPQKLEVIKIIKDLLNIGLKEAKNLADNAPSTIKSGIPRNEAEAIKAQLIALGAEVELIEQLPSTEDDTSDSGNGSSDSGNDTTATDVVLKNAGAQKIEVIKIIKELLNIGLKDAKDLADNTPTTIKSDIPKNEAEAIKAQLIAVGAEVVLIEQLPSTEDDTSDSGNDTSDSGNGTSDSGNDTTATDIVLKNAGAQKLEVVKKIKELLNIGLKDAKDFADNAPSTIKSGIPKNEADTIKAQLVAIGAEVELIEQLPSTDDGTSDSGKGTTTVDVVLKKAGAQKLEVIKKIKELLNIGLKDAKDLIEKAPATIKSGIPKNEAETIKAKLVAIGAEVELIEQLPSTDDGTSGSGKGTMTVDVVLKKAGAQKLEVIKKIKELLNIGLKDTKDLVEKAPTTIKSGIPKNEADTIKAQLVAIGAEVELIEQLPSTDDGTSDSGKGTTTVDVVLKNAGAQKLEVIKKIKELLSIGLKDTKDLVEKAPTTIKSGIPRNEAEAIKTQLVAIGADVELKEQQPSTDDNTSGSGKGTTTVDVVLKNAGAQKLEVIKKIKELLNIGLKDAKDLVEKAPTTIKCGIPKNEAETIKAQLVAVGAIIEFE